MYDWRAVVGGTAAENVYAIGEDFVVLRNPPVNMLESPFKVDMVAVIVLTGGTGRGRINLVSIEAVAPCMIIMSADQIIQADYVSEDFNCYVVVMSPSFVDSLNINERMDTFRTVSDNPVIPLTGDRLPPILTYIEMMCAVTRLADNPYRMEVAQNLTRAFFYGGGFYFHKLDENVSRNSTDRVANEFMKLLDANFKRHRKIEFYAERMDLTPKYMSSLMRKLTGRSAGEWIDRRVIMEAKALLRSTNMTVQQIADELNFPEQSAFGKYFKRHTGLSPKEYRK